MPYNKLLFNKNEFDKDFISIIDTYEKSYLSFIYDEITNSKEEITTISEENSSDKKSDAPKKKRKFFENFFFSMD